MGEALRLASGVARQCDLHDHEAEIMTLVHELVMDPANAETLQAMGQARGTLSKQALGLLVCERLKGEAWFPFKEAAEIKLECAKEGNGPPSPVYSVRPRLICKASVTGW